MATGRFDYELRANASGFTSEVQKAERSVQQLEKAQKGAADSSANWNKAAQATAVGIAALAAAGTLVLRKVIQKTAEQDRVMAQLNATLKSTGGVSGKTAEELSKTASSLQKITTFGDEAIISAQSLLLTFKNIRGDTFDRTTRAVLDLSTAMGTDLKSSALQLGKALESPTKGISALTRSGVSFSEAQKEVIKSLAESGRLAEAQTIILKELETQFGGSAEAARNTMGGALKALSNSWGDLFEVQQTASAGMTESINSLNATISDPAFKSQMDILIGGLIDVVNWSAKGAAALVWLFQTINGTRKETLVEMGEEIHIVTKALESMEKQGRGNGLAAQAQRAKLKELQKAYDELAASINKASKPVEQLSPIMVTAEQRTTKLTAATTSLAKSCDAVKLSVEDLSPIIVTATRKTADFGKTSEEVAETTSSVWEDVRTTLSGMFFEMAADGQNAFDVLVNGFKAMIAKMVAEAAANTILLAVGVGAAGTASAGGASAAGGGGGIGSLFSTASSGYSWLKGGGIGSSVQGGFNALATGYEGVAQFASQQGWHGVAGAAQTSAGQYTGGLGASAANLGLNVGAGMIGTYAGQQVFQNKGSTGIGATGGAIVGSIWGPIGTAVGAFVGEGIEKAFASAFGYSGQKKNRASIGFDTSTDYAAALGGKHDKDNLRNANDLFSVINQMADMLGGNLSGTIRVSNRDGVEISGLGKFKSSTDALKAITERLIETSTTISESLKPLILDFKGTTEEVTRFAVAISSINTMAGINTVTNAIKDFALVQPNATESYKTHTDALKDQIRAFDGSLSAAENLNTVLNENKTAAYQFALSIQSIGRSISEMAGGQAASIRESVLTPQQLLNRRYDQRDTLAASLLTESDPERAAATAQRLLEVNKQIFDSITDDQQLLFAENFAKVAEDTNSVTQYILQKSLDGLKTTQDELNSQVSAMLQKLATDNQKAAEMQLQAANINLQAAQLNGGRGQVAV
jgi:uncharacterized coiled-coil DUF342 family protein